MKVIAVANAKGGSGKTSVAVNLAAGLARRGKRTLLVDLDPQGNASTWLLGMDRDGPGIAEAVLGRRLAPAHLRQVEGRPGLSIAPSSRPLADLDLALANAVGGQVILRRVLEEQAKAWDFVVLDTPPAVGVHVVSAIIAADGVVAPFPAGFLSLDGLRILEESVDRARELLGARARLLGYVLFAADGREGLTEEVREIVHRDRPGRLYRSAVRVSTAAKASPSRRRTAWDAGEDPRGAEDFEKVTDETLERLDRRGKGGK